MKRLITRVQLARSDYEPQHLDWPDVDQRKSTTLALMYVGLVAGLIRRWARA